MVIIDMGSGNTCLNQESIISDMIDQFVKADTHKHEVVIKWQLFEKAGDNIPLRRDAFIYAYKLAEKYGYQTTASVFDMNSLDFLLRFDILFVKIANRPDLYWLTDKIEDVPIIKSIASPELFDGNCLCCVSDYPAKAKDYEKIFSEEQLRKGISDHTTDWKLYKKYQPKHYECHFKLEDSIGLDAGPFARTPSQLKEIL